MDVNTVHYKHGYKRFNANSRNNNANRSYNDSSTKYRHCNKAGHIHVNYHKLQKRKGEYRFGVN